MNTQCQVLMCSLVVGIHSKIRNIPKFIHRGVRSSPASVCSETPSRPGSRECTKVAGLEQRSYCFAAHMTDVMTTFFREHSVLEAGSLTMSSQLIDLVVIYTSFVLQVGILSCRSFAHVSQPQCFVDSSAELTPPASFGRSPTRWAAVSSCSTQRGVQDFDEKCLGIFRE